MAARTHQARCASSSAPVAPRGQGEARRVSGVPSSTGGGSGVRAAAAVRRPTGTCVPWLCTPFGSLARVSGTMAMSIGATTPLPKPRLQNPGTRASSDAAWPLTPRSVHKISNDQRRELCWSLETDRQMFCTADEDLCVGKMTTFPGGAARVPRASVTPREARGAPAFPPVA